jgi:hypothetical protein
MRLAFVFTVLLLFYVVPLNVVMGCARPLRLRFCSEVFEFVSFRDSLRVVNILQFVKGFGGKTSQPSIIFVLKEIFGYA